MSDDKAQEQQDIGTKVHGDKMATPGHHTAATNPPADAASTAGTAGGAEEGRDAAAINPDHPDRASAAGTGGLLPGGYEQANGEAGHQGAAPQPAVEAVRGAGSRVPDPKADPTLRERALDIADGGPAR